MNICHILSDNNCQTTAYILYYVYWAFISKLDFSYYLNKTVYESQFMATGVKQK